MKRFLIPLLAALALPTAVEACILGNCGSEYEAWKACNEWASKGGSTLLNNYSFSDDLIDQVNTPFESLNRSCNYDYGSKKILGIDKNGKVKKRYKF